MPDYRRIAALMHDHPLWPPTALCVILVTLVLAQWIAVLQGHEAPAAPAVAAAPATVAKGSMGKRAALFTQPLFGEYVPANLQDATIRQSSLDIAVAGILYSPDPRESQVILRFADGQEMPFRVGDTLPGGVKIRRITPEGIVVWHEGALESLTLPKNELNFEPPPKPLVGE